MAKQTYSCLCWGASLTRSYGDQFLIFLQSSIFFHIFCICRTLLIFHVKSNSKLVFFSTVVWKHSKINFLFLDMSSFIRSFTGLLSTTNLIFATPAVYSGLTWFFLSVLASCSSFHENIDFVQRWYSWLEKNREKSRILCHVQID